MAWILMMMNPYPLYEVQTYPINNKQMKIHLNVPKGVWRVIWIGWKPCLLRHTDSIATSFSFSSQSSGSSSGGGNGGGSGSSGGGGGGGGGSSSGVNTSAWGGIFVFYILGGTEKDVKLLFEKTVYGKYKELCRKRDANLIMVKSFSVRSHSWELVAIRSGRSMDTVYLDQNIKNDINNDIEEFFQKQDWYEELNVPFRRGYLLHGPPGCGKSSLIAAAASALGKHISVFNMNQQNINDLVVVHAMKTLDRNSILVLEDIDSMVIDRKSEEGKKQFGSMPSINMNSHGGGGVSLSCLLNVLDGLVAVEGILVFMTTNFPERLDEALFRPGRCDKQYKLSLCSTHQAIQMFKRFFPTCVQTQIQSIQEQFKTNTISVAKLQTYFLNYQNDPKSCVDNLFQLWEEEEMEQKHDVIDDKHHHPSHAKVSIPISQPHMKTLYSFRNHQMSVKKSHITANSPNISLQTTRKQQEQYQQQHLRSNDKAHT